MLRRALVLLSVAGLAFMMTGCGQTYDLQSITVSNSLAGTSSEFNIEGIGNTQPLVVTAHYSNGKTEDVTVHSTYALGVSTDSEAPADAVTVSSSGIIQAIVSPKEGIAACTWTATPTTDKCTAWSYSTQPYPITVTYQGQTAVGYLSVAAAGACYDGISYIPASGYGC